MVFYLYSGNLLNRSKEGYATTQAMKNVLSFCGEMGFKTIAIFGFGDFILKIIYTILCGKIIVMVYPGLLRPMIKEKIPRFFYGFVYFLFFGFLGIIRKTVLYVIDLPIDQRVSFSSRTENIPKFSIVLEKILFKTATRILVFNDNMKNVIHHRYSIPTERFINFEILDYHTKNTNVGNAVIKKTFKIVYAAGRLYREYLENFVKNLSESKYGLFEFFGEGGEWINELKFKNIFYKGSLSPDRLSEYISKNAHAGIVRNEQKHPGIIAYHNLTSTSKFGLFISSSVPVFCPDTFEYIYSLVEKYGVGWMYSNSRDIDKVIMNVLSNDQMYSKVKNNCLVLQEKVWSGRFFKKAVRKAVLEIANEQ